VTVPEYRRTFLTGRLHCASTDTARGCDEAITDCATPIVSSIVRLKCIDAVADSDWMFISNLRALKEAMRCIQKEDANQPQEAENHYQNALRALRNELEQYSPKERMAVNVLSFGTAKPRRIFGGFI
jgi:hypothetical protein